MCERHAMPVMPCSESTQIEARLKKKGLPYGSYMNIFLPRQLAALQRKLSAASSAGSGAAGVWRLRAPHAPRVNSNTPGA